MNSKLIAFICLVLFTYGCSHNGYPPVYFQSSADALRQDYNYWLSHGRPADFQPSQVAGRADEYFVYTNIIKTTNGVFHCRFGSRFSGWPPGVLAITDEGQFLFICTNGNVTISPEAYGVDP